MRTEEVQEGGSLDASQLFQGRPAQQEVADQFGANVRKPRQYLRKVALSGVRSGGC